MTTIFVCVGALLVVTLLARAARVDVRVSTKVNFRDLRDFSRAFNQRTIEYMRANYSGRPEQLEECLRGFVPLARELAAQQTPVMDDRLLRTLLIGSVVGNRIATRAQVEAALAHVFEPERLAA